MTFKVQNPSTEARKDLHLFPNHFRTYSEAPTRIWDSKTQGQAISDGKGWYLRKEG